MKLKSKKSALLMSFTSLLICFAMLASSTFAWFTDTATTGVNKIVSGKLKVDIVDENGAHLNDLSFQDKDSKTDIRWEPGVKFLTQGFKIKNDGNLALKWKMAVNKGVKGATDDFDLKDVIDFSIVTIDNTADTPVETEVDLAAFEGELPSGMSEVYYLKGHMQESAGNDYQNLSLNDITVTVYATQLSYENDSYGPDYDKDATYPTYPAGVTKESFPESVDYSTWTGAAATAPATAAYVDNNGEVQYTADIKTALDNGASTIYLKKDTKGRLMALTDFLAQPNRTSDVTKDITIYANGADFEYGELAINTTDAGKNANFTIKIYDAKNIRVWGNTPNTGVTQNIILENCTYEGTGIGTNAAGGIFFAYGETGTINLTMNNCKVSGSDQGVYFGCDGSLTVKDSSFTECATGIKVSYKGAGTRTDRIENCVFTKCGCTTAMAGTSSYLAEDSAAFKYKKNTEGGQITLTLKNNKITGTIGDKGDMQFIGVTPVNE